jgi:hypothetical protein
MKTLCKYLLRIPARAYATDYFACGEYPGRYEEMKPSLLVSNLTVDEIIDYLGDRVFDRMRENGGAVLAFNWTSHRQRRP